MGEHRPGAEHGTVQLRVVEPRGCLGLSDVSIQHRKQRTPCLQATATASSSVAAGMPGCGWTTPPF